MDSNRFDQISKQLENAFAFVYKGVLFDLWVIDEETKGIWAEMCQDCAEKYKDVLSQELSEGGVGACSVRGCDVVGADCDNERHYYVDFQLDLIKPLTMEQLYSLFPEQEALDDRIEAAHLLLSKMPSEDEPDRSEWDRY